MVRRFLALLLLIPLVAACGGSPSNGMDDEATGGVIRIVTPYRVKSLDPIQQGLWSPEWGYGELLTRATDSGKIEPWLLESLERESDTVWRLTLRDKVTFANGHRLDAEALKAVFDRHLAENALAKANLPGASVAVVDDRTVSLTTASPVANLPNLLADEQMISVFDAKEAATASSPADLLKKGIYTGPFTVTALTSDEMILERNPRYWGGKVTLAGARVQFVPDGKARVLAVRNHEADLALYPPTELLAEFSGNGNGPAVVRAPVALQQLRAIINERRAPMNEVAVRRAFALAIDYSELAEKVLDGLYSTPTGIYPSTLPYAAQTTRSAPSEAQTILDAAGWKLGADGVREKKSQRLSLTMLTYPQQPDTKSVAVALQAQLTKLGFDVKIREVEDNYEAMRQPDWDVGLSLDGSLGYTFDPVGPLRDFLTTDGVKNFGGVSDATLDSLVSELSATFDEGARIAKLKQAQELIAGAAHSVVLASRPSMAVADRAWASYRPSSTLHHLTAKTRAG